MESPFTVFSLDIFFAFHMQANWQFIFQNVIIQLTSFEFE